MQSRLLKTIARLPPMINIQSGIKRLLFLLVTLRIRDVRLANLDTPSTTPICRVRSYACPLELHQHPEAEIPARNKTQHHNHAEEDISLRDLAFRSTAMRKVVTSSLLIVFPLALSRDDE